MEKPAIPRRNLASTQTSLMYGRDRNEQGSFINADGDTEDDALWKIIYILRTNKKCLRPPRVRKNLWHPVYNCVDQFGEPIGLKICSS